MFIYLQSRKSYASLTARCISRRRCVEAGLGMLIITGLNINLHQLCSIMATMDVIHSEVVEDGLIDIVLSSESVECMALP